MNQRQILWKAQPIDLSKEKRTILKNHYIQM